MIYYYLGFIFFLLLDPDPNVLCFCPLIRAPEKCFSLIIPFPWDVYTHNDVKQSLGLDEKKE